MSGDVTSRDLAEGVRGAIERSLPHEHPAHGKIHPYGAAANVEVTEALRTAAHDLGVSYEVGATVTASGFFAPQGRDVGRISPSVVDLDRVIAADPRFINMEMETAFLLHFCGGHGFRAGAICVVAANRELNTFVSGIASHMNNAVRVALRALAATTQ